LPAEAGNRPQGSEIRDHKNWTAEIEEIGIGKKEVRTGKKEFGGHGVQRLQIGVLREHLEELIPDS
jgi:hypothetical protein